jgi:hypothetical protein
MREKPAAIDEARMHLRNTHAAGERLIVVCC